MEKWIIPCNQKKYFEIEKAVMKLPKVNWKQTVKSICVGDEVYIYVCKPTSAIKYKCVVTKVNLRKIEINDKDYVRDDTPFKDYGNYMELKFLETFSDNRYSLDVLKNKGLKGNIQSQRRALGLLD